jgi:hypothetical protein
MLGCWDLALVARGFKWHTTLTRGCVQIIGLLSARDGKCMLHQTHALPSLCKSEPSGWRCGVTLRAASCRQGEEVLRQRQTSCMLPLHRALCPRYWREHACRPTGACACAFGSRAGRPHRQALVRASNAAADRRRLACHTYLMCFEINFSVRLSRRSVGAHGHSRSFSSVLDDDAVASPSGRPPRLPLDHRPPFLGKLCGLDTTSMSCISRQLHCCLEPSLQTLGNISHSRAMCHSACVSGQLARSQCCALDE